MEIIDLCLLRPWTNESLVWFWKRSPPRQSVSWVLSLCWFSNGGSAFWV